MYVPQRKPKWIGSKHWNMYRRWAGMLEGRGTTPLPSPGIAPAWVHGIFGPQESIDLAMKYCKSDLSKTLAMVDLGFESWEEFVARYAPSRRNRGRTIDRA